MKYRIIYNSNFDAYFPEYFDEKEQKYKKIIRKELEGYNATIVKGVHSHWARFDDLESAKQYILQYRNQLKESERLVEEFEL